MKACNRAVAADGLMGCHLGCLVSGAACRGASPYEFRFARHAATGADRAPEGGRTKLEKGNARLDFPP
jgi:hypothetical protein